MEEKWVALEMVVHIQDDHLETRLKNGSCTSKCTTAWHQGVGEAFLNTPLQSFLCSIATEEEWPAPAIVVNFQDDHPKNSLETAIFGH